MSTAQSSTLPYFELSAGSSTECSKRDELKRSLLGSWILFAYKLLNCRRRWRLGRPLMQLAIRLEGGPMISATAREIMRKFHGVEIGAFSYGPCFDPAKVPPNVKIGRFVSIAPGVRLIVQNHPIRNISTHPMFYETQPGVAETAQLAPGNLTVGHDAWLGYNAVITPGCNRIGIGAVIGAGAVVTRDVPDFAIVAGNPAREIGKRFSPFDEELVANSNWWMRHREDTQNFSLDTLRAKHHSEEVIASRKTGPKASIIIPAHNEEVVIARCLRKLLEDANPGEFEVIVVCNGCTDATKKIASGFGSSVRVLESTAASKTAALNMGDLSASVFPRIYLDADIEIDAASIRAVCQELRGPGVLAAAPRVRWDLTRSSVWVRAFYRVWKFQPYFSKGHLGSGLYAVNETGHLRLQQFVHVTADDEYVRQLYSEAETAMVKDHFFTSTAPARLSDLIKIKTRSRRGNMELKQTTVAKTGKRKPSTLVFLRGLLCMPQMWPAASVYFYVILRTFWRARRTLASSSEVAWERDLSSRQLS